MQKSTQPITVLLISCVLLMTATLSGAQAAAPANTNLISNGSFAAGLNGWSGWNLQMQVVNGVFEVARWAGTPDGGFFQVVNFQVPAGASLELTFKMGNRSSAAKSVTMLLRNNAWTDQRSCPFSVPAASPLQTYTMRFRTSAVWSPIVLQGLIAPGDSLLAVQITEVNLQYRPSSSFNTTAECIVTPPSNVNLLYNGDFSAPHTSAWATWNSTAQTSGGIFEIARNASTADGGFFQWNPYSLPNGASFEFTLNIGNRSTVAKSINLLVRDPAWGDMKACWYTLQPGTSLRSVTIRARTTRPWSNIVVQGWLQNADGLMALQFDNLSLVYRPSSTFGTLECGAPVATLEQQVLDLVNQQRCAARLVPLVFHPQLNAAAVRHSNDLAFNMRTYISHTGTDGTQPWDRTRQAGYPGGTIAENAAAGFSTAQSVFNAWWNSSGHRSNMMGSSYRETGISMVQNQAASFRYYWTQVFGTRSGATGGVCPTEASGIDPAALVGSLDAGLLIDPVAVAEPSLEGGIPADNGIAAPPIEDAKGDA